MKNSGLITIALVLISYSGFTQSSINGKISDTEESGVSFANVLLLDIQDSSLVKGAVSNEDGTYLLSDVAKGSYFIESYMVGYNKSYTPAFSINGQNGRVVKDIILTEGVRELDEVVVKATKPLYEMEMGKMVVNVQSSITSAGQSIIDVLEKSPGISVDRQSNTFSVSGKSGVIVLINGKRSRMPVTAVYQLMEGMNADNVEKIEIMSVPPSNYDAEGDAGMINIVTKQAIEDGTNGSLMTNLGYASGLQAGGSLNLNHRRGKLSMYGNYSYNYMDYIQDFDFFRESVTETDQVSASILTDRDAYRGTHNFQFGLDYALSDKTIIGGVIGGYDNLWKMNSISDIEYNYSNSPDTTLYMDMGETNHWQHLMGNVNLQHTFTRDQVLTVNLDYLAYKNSNPTTYVNKYFNITDDFFNISENRIFKDTPINIWVAKIDYSMKLGSMMTLETGVKGAFSSLTNDVLFEEKAGETWNKGDRFSSYADLSENVMAAFGALQVKFDEKTSMNAGLRYEYTDVFLSSEEENGLVDREYGSLFPTVFVTRKFNKENSVQFSYGRRITRPQFNEMAPWVIFSDPNTLISGNANILPTFTNNIKADYAFKNYIVSLQYSRDENVIARFQPQYDPETNILIITTENIDKSQTVSSTLILPIQITDWWEMQNNMTGNWQKISTDNENLAYVRDIFGFQANTNNTFRLPGGFTTELSGFYSSPRISGYYNILSRYMVNIGIQKEFNNNSSLKFSVNDLLETGYQIQMKSVVNTDGLSYGAYLKFQKRMFTLTYSLKFGDNKVKALRKRSVGSEDESGRVSN